MEVFTSDDPLNVEIYTYLGRHYLYYLSAGVLAFGEALRSGIADVGGGWQAIFAPFINLYHAVFGGWLLAPGSALEKGMMTDLTSTDPTGTNVYTMIGTLHLYLGPLGASVYLFAVGLLGYGFLILTRKQNSIWITASYCLVASQLALGFFELYFWTLTVYEITVMGILLAIVTKAGEGLFARRRPVLSL
jgi:hypothetical protein